jgi:hypothetical protein
MKKILLSLQSIWSLGINNVLSVLIYRLGLKTHLHPACRLKAKTPKGPFFSECFFDPVNASKSNKWDGKSLSFSWYEQSLEGQCPDWFLNPFTGKRYTDCSKKWWKIPDFDPEVGDIKAVWEASRFDWVIAMAQRSRNGEKESLKTLNHWLEDWNEKNPPYNGPNWKCGQEASFRVLHLAIVGVILGQIEKTLPGLSQMLHVHLRRIDSTTGYAMAQDNNHGTSEAAALFIGGKWLESLGDPLGEKWATKGRKLLEDRINRLVMKDGSFSQYSVNYHRLLLDTVSLVELFRIYFKAPSFAKDWYFRVKLATEWLRSFVDESNGNVPNLGANDGALLLPLSTTSYRDYRPSVQLASVLFVGPAAYKIDGPWNDILKWLNHPVQENTVSPLRQNQNFDEGGYTVLCSQAKNITVIFRYPRFRFRPGHSDALHVDLWKDGLNLLRDGGSFSYSDLEWHQYFSGVESHNTIQFDGRDQMPRLSRFLYGKWLKTERYEEVKVSDDEVSTSAGYIDWQGARHFRKLVQKENLLEVTDEIEGFSKNAVLRWRLFESSWRLLGGILSDGKYTLTVDANVPVVRIELVEGWESLYYLNKKTIPVLEVEVRKPGKIRSEFRW